MCFISTSGSDPQHLPENLDMEKDQKYLNAGVLWKNTKKDPGSNPGQSEVFPVFFGGEGTLVCSHSPKTSMFWSAGGSNLKIASSRSALYKLDKKTDGWFSVFLTALIVGYK